MARNETARVISNPQGQLWFPEVAQVVGFARSEAKTFSSRVNMEVAWRVRSLSILGFFGEEQRRRHDWVNEQRSVK